MYVRNFDLVLRTCLLYDHLFLPEERSKIELFLQQENAAKTIYARMFFRRRYWYNLTDLKKYSDRLDHLETAAQRLYKAGLLRSDEDAVFEDDFERIHELLETMQLTQVKAFETELKKVIKSLPQTALNNHSGYDLISHNPFNFLRNTFQGIFSQVSA